MARHDEAGAALRVLGTVVFVVSALLLTSIGGAGIMASPVTLPFMYALARAHPSPSFLGAGLLIGTLTAFEGGWGLGYALLDHSHKGAVLVGVSAAALAAFTFARIPYRASFAPVRGTRSH